MSDSDDAPAPIRAELNPVQRPEAEVIQREMGGVVRGVEMKVP